MLDADIPNQIDQFPFVLNEKVMVIADIGVEIGAAAIDGDRAQQSGSGELVQGVVDGGQRDMDAGCLSFGTQIFRRKMAMSLAKRMLLNWTR